MIFDKAIRNIKNQSSPESMTLIDNDAWSIGLDMSGHDSAM